MRRTDASLAAMALLAASVQGTVLTLSTVEMITSFAVPLSCIFAYNTPISGCETTDFTIGRCSPDCQRGLLRVQTNIQASCTTVDPQPNSLIWEAQKGNLVNALCNREPPHQSTTRTQSRATSSTTSALSITVTVSVSSTTSSKMPSSTQTMSSATLTTTPTTTPTTTLTTTSTTLLTVSSTSTESSSNDDTESTTESGSISTTSISSQETTTETESPASSSSSTTATKTAKPTRDPELGAGDPFANFPNSSGRLGPCVCSLLLTFIVIGLM